MYVAAVYGFRGARGLDESTTENCLYLFRLVRIIIIFFFRPYLYYIAEENTRGHRRYTGTNSFLWSLPRVSEFFRIIRLIPEYIII